MTKLQAWEPYRKFKITGTLVATYPNGVTIDDARGVRWYVDNKRVIGEVAPEDEKEEA